jgi:hypothetical protein
MSGVGTRFLLEETTTESKPLVTCKRLTHREQAAVSRAKALGGFDADAIFRALGGDPDAEVINDWCHLLWELRWDELKELGANESIYELCLATYRQGIFGSIWPDGWPLALASGRLTTACSSG